MKTTSLIVAFTLCICGCATTQQQQASKGVTNILKDVSTALNDVQALTPVASAIATQVSGTNAAKVNGYISAVNSDITQAEQDANMLSSVVSTLAPVTTGT